MLNAQDNQKDNQKDSQAVERRAPEQALRMAFVHASVGMSLADRQDHFFEVNPAFCALTGYTEAELLAANSLALTHPEDLPANTALMDRLWAGEIPSFDIEKRYLRRDGTVVWVRNSVSLVRDAAGTPLHTLALTQDVTARREAEAALRRSREDLRLAVGAARLGTFYCDYPWDKIIWNDTCKEHFFLPPDAEVDFTLFYSLLHPDDREPTRQAIERAMEERAEYNVEYRTQAPDRRTRWVNAVGRVYYDEAGGPVRFDGVTIDISERKQVEEELRRRAAREALLNRVNEALRSTTDPELIGERAAALVGDALGVDRCYFSVYDAARDAVRITRDWRRVGLASLAGEYRLSEYQDYVDALYARGTASVEDAPAAPPPVRQVLDRLGIRALLAVPLLDDGRFVAALTASMTSRARVWTPEEVSLMEAVLTQTRTAAEAARVARREHTIAEQLAQALQPDTPDAVPGLELAEFYRPAREDQGVGGDFSDVFAADKGVTYLVVGDLSGKGLEAASEVAMVRHMLRFALYNGRTVAGPVTRLNETLAGRDLLRGFATLFVGRYDAGTRALTYVNCGQDAGLVLRAATGRVESLPPTGPVLGGFGEAVYDERSVTLEAGDVLALYTDGLTEAGPTRAALLTGDGVADLLAQRPGPESASETVSRLMAGVDAHARGGVRDDQCLLVGVAAPGG